MKQMVPRSCVMSSKRYEYESCLPFGFESASGDLSFIESYRPDKWIKSKRGRALALSSAEKKSPGNGDANVPRKFLRPFKNAAYALLNIIDFFTSLPFSSLVIIIGSPSSFVSFRCYCYSSFFALSLAYIS